MVISGIHRSIDTWIQEFHLLNWNKAGRANLELNSLIKPWVRYMDTGVPFIKLEQSWPRQFRAE